MTDDWDFYAARVDDRPASIFVDLGAAQAAPVETLPFRAHVRLFMNSPRPDGLSSQDEFNQLGAIEDHLTGELSREDSAYVGRCTTDGCRDFYFYVGDPGGWEERVRAAMTGFTEYEFDAGVSEDRAWSSYFDFLYPGEVDCQRIQNRRTCEALEANGDPLAQPREIDHWAYFSTADGRDAFLREAIELGFRSRELSESEEDDPRHGARVWRPDVPAYEGIDAVTLPLFEAACRYGGEYDGWECEVVGGRPAITDPATLETRQD